MRGRREEPIAPLLRPLPLPVPLDSLSLVGFLDESDSVLPKSTVVRRRWYRLLEVLFYELQ